LGKTKKRKLVNTKKKKNEFFEWVKALFFAFGFVFLITHFLFSPIYINGDSMKPSLDNGNRMLINKISYNPEEIKHFDIVVFKVPQKDDYIKRVIGLPGDQIAYKDDQLFINGKLQDEPYLKLLKDQLVEGERSLTEDFVLEDYTNVSVIPEGYVFIMGDNRRYSKDSRIMGLIPIEDIKGNAGIIFWPLNKIRVVK
jgi:signal peptidase I